MAASLSAAAANAVASISASSIKSLQHVVTGLRSAPADEASSVHSLAKSLHFAAVAQDKQHAAATCTAAYESSGLRAAAVIERELYTTAATAATVAATAAAIKLCGLQAEVDCLHAAATAVVAEKTTCGSARRRCAARWRGSEQPTRPRFAPARRAPARRRRN